MPIDEVGTLLADLAPQTSHYHLHFPRHRSSKFCLCHCWRHPNSPCRWTRCRKMGPKTGDHWAGICCSTRSRGADPVPEYPRCSADRMRAILRLKVPFFGKSSIDWIIFGRYINISLKGEISYLILFLLKMMVQAKIHNFKRIFIKLNFLETIVCKKTFKH